MSYGGYPPSGGAGGYGAQPPAYGGYPPQGGYNQPPPAYGGYNQQPATYPPAGDAQQPPTAYPQQDIPNSHQQHMALQQEITKFGKHMVIT